MVIIHRAYTWYYLNGGQVFRVGALCSATDSDVYLVLKTCRRTRRIGDQPTFDSAFIQGDI